MTVLHAILNVFSAISTVICVVSCMKEDYDVTFYSRIITLAINFVRRWINKLR